MSGAASGTTVLSWRRTDLAQDFLLKLARMVALRREHPTSDGPVEAAARELYSSFEALAAHLGNVEVRVSRDMVRVNQYLAHVRGIPGTEELDPMIAEFRAMNLGSLVLAAEAPPEAFWLLTGVLQTAPRRPPEERLPWAMDEVARHYPESLDLIAATAFEEVAIDTFEVGDETRDDVVLRLYCYLQALARYVHGEEPPPGEDLEREIHLGVGRLARLVATHRDAVLACAAAFVPFGDPLAEHAANRTLLAAALAQRAGLDDRSIRVLADAALHADAGLALLDEEVQVVPDPREDASVPPGRAARCALRTLDTSGPLANLRARTVVALELHGWASVAPPRRTPPHLFSRIVSIADAYASLTHERPDRAPLTAPGALRFLEDELHDRLDASLLAAFVGMLGPYPPGTPVLLDTGEVGVVRRPSEDPRQADKPVVLVVGDPEEWYRSAVEVDLLHDPDGGAVVGVLHPDELPFATAAVYFRPEVLYEA